MKIVKHSVIVLSLMVGFVSSHAQDDVSIMDLKETVYYLMKDVQKMKETQGTALSGTKKVSMQNIDIISSLSDEVENLKNELKELRSKEVLGDYKVSAKLQNFVK